MQTAVVASLGFLTARKPDPPTQILVALCAVGVLSAVVWYLLLRSYRDLNTAKFAVIHEVEKALPIQLFADEWKTLKQDPVTHWRKRYAELGSVERIAPVLFAAINIILAVYLVAS
jgi:hypothetical protein